jgi:beta-N-acetylhexosaminidase
LDSLERLAGSVLCVGFHAADTAGVPTAELAALGPGGIVLFARNASDADGTRALIERAVEACGGDQPAFAAVDQEGGRVARFVRDAAPLPSLMAVGAAADPELAERCGRALARDLRRFGANLDFAPVLDLALDPGNTVIGTRSAGADPDLTGTIGAAIVAGLQGAGIAACAKHFPGHGATAVDSHLDLPVLATDAQTLEERELVPFRRAIEAGVRAVMTAHIVTTAFDGEPATLSRAVLTDLLRGRLGFTGACFTDSMEMGAIARTIGTVPAIVRAIAAGADCALVSHDLDLARTARDAIAAAVRDGELDADRLAEASSRVAALRAWCQANRSDPAAPDPGLALEVAARALRIVRGSPFLERGVAVNVISFEGRAASGAEERHESRPSLALALRERRVSAEAMRVPIDPTESMIAHLAEVLAMQPERRLVIVMRRAHLHWEQRRAVEALLAAAPDALLISAAEPYDAEIFPQARSVVCSYGDEAMNVEALAGLLSSAH